jgi:glycine cleavage system aminomethyltransferase T
MIVTDYDYEPHRRTPYDLGLDRLVALDADGEFRGKEPLREIAEAPPNRFVTIRLLGEPLPVYGAAVTAGGVEAGVLTRPATRPALGPLGLAIMPTEHAAPGTAVEVAMPDGSTTSGTVDVLAVLDPKKERPRA